MRLLILFNFSVFITFGQIDTIRVKKLENYYPKIAGIQFGEIPFWKLCASEGIETEKKSKIFSFDMQYFGNRGLQELHISGNRIPDSVCIQIGAFGINNMVFFNNIKAISLETGELLHLSSMNLMPIKNE